MRKKQDVIWETSTLWEQVEKYVMRYLKKNHPEYQQIKVQAAELIEQHSALWQLMNEKTGVTLPPEDHAALHQYFQLSSTMQTFEEECYFFAGQMMALSYGSMLERLKKELLETDDSTSSHLIDLLVLVRTDEVEEQLQGENAEYRERIGEEKHCEEELQKLNLSRAERKAIDRYVTAINNRWIFCGEQLYKAGMKDALELVQSK